MSNDNKGGDPVSGAAQFAKDEILGGRQWRRSKIASLTGTSSILDAVDSTKANGRLSIGRVSTLLGAAFRPDTSGEAIPETITDPRERFLASMQRNGRTSQDIAKSVEVTYSQFWLYVGLMLATIALAAFTFPPMATIRGPLDFLMSTLFRLIPMPLLGALALRAGWTNWTFRRFRLEGLGPYLASGKDMLPQKSLSRRAATAPASASARNGMTKRIGLIVAVGLGAFVAMHLHATPAFADNLSDGQAAANRVFVDPGADDLFIKLMTYVIPNAGPIPANSTAGGAGPYQLIRDGLSLFAATLLFVGMLMSGWQIITGIVASAKEGTAIGRAYHEVWAPVRTVIGYGMLVPVANGLCGAQILCLYLIAWGGNLANVIWKPYVEKAVYESKSTNQENLVNQSVDTMGSSISNGIIQALFEKELCRATIQTAFIRTGYVMYGAAAPSSSPSFTQSIGNQLNYFNRDNVYTADYGPICGTLELSVRAVVSGQATDNQGVSYDTGLEDNTSSVIGQARKTAIEKIKGNIDSVAQAAAQTYQVNAGSAIKYFSPEGEGYKSLPAQINTWKRDYLNTLKSEIKKALPSGQSQAGADMLAQMKAKAQQDGWAASGTYYLTLARVQGNLYAAAFGGLKSDPITQQSVSNMSSELANTLFGNRIDQGILVSFRTFWAAKTNQITQDATANLMKAGSNSVIDSITDWSLWTAGLFMHLDVNPLNPMQAMIDYGDFLMRTGMGIYLGVMAIKSGGALLGMLGGAGVAASGLGAGAGVALTALSAISSAAFEAIATPLTLVAGAIVIAGAVHSYVIPLIPYIMVLFFVGSMLTLTVESLVAAPLWAFFHIRLDGGEFIDQVQKPGYMIAFNLLLRPVLMIFGLILSMLTFGAMSWFVNMTFIPAANGLSASTTVGPIGAAVLVLMLAYLNLTLATKSFHLITEIPDRVTRWFGQAGERLDEQGDTKQITGAVIGAAASRGEGVVANVMTGKLMGGMRGGMNGNSESRNAAKRVQGALRGGGGGAPEGPGGDGPGGGGGEQPGKPSLGGAAKIAGAAKGGAAGV